MALAKANSQASPLERQGYLIRRFLRIGTPAGSVSVLIWVMILGTGLCPLHTYDCFQNCVISRKLMIIILMTNEIWFMPFPESLSPQNGVVVRASYTVYTNSQTSFSTRTRTRTLTTGSASHIAKLVELV